MKYRIFNIVWKIWAAYCWTCMFIGSLITPWIIFAGFTFTIGERSLQWKGIFHYTLLPIFNWFYKV